MLNQIKYNRENKTDFHRVLQSRVNSYFKEKGISKHANTNMILKTIFMIALYLVPFTLMLTMVSNTWMTAFIWVVMGFGMAGIGLSVMHDANHGAYSKNQTINMLLGNLMNIVGGSDVNWRVQHNMLHHTYTNVSGMDEDIDSGLLMRFSPEQQHLKGHRFQFLYAWFLYGMMTIMWVFSKDFKQFSRYRKLGLLKSQGKSESGMLSKLIIFKVAYIAVFLVLPIIFSPVAWWLTVLFFIMMHFVAGLTLACIFQPAHVIPSSDFNAPHPETGVIANDWAASQLLNTANFAPRSKIFSWYVGGLNYQIEHHLFPTICHVHYKHISRIVKETAFEYGLPYYSYQTFTKALAEHAKLLYHLGKPPVMTKVGA